MNRRDFIHLFLRRPQGRRLLPVRFAAASPPAAWRPRSAPSHGVHIWRVGGLSKWVISRLVSTLKGP